VEVPKWVVRNLKDKSKTNLRSSDKIEFICPIHGEYTQKLYTHINLTKGCPRCSRSKSLKESRKRKRPRWKELEKLIGEDKTKDLGCFDKVTLVCDKHGPYEQTVNSFLEGRNGCQECRWENYSKVRSKNERAKNPYPESFYDDLYDKEKFLKVKPRALDKVDFWCPDHGKYSQRLADHLRGSGCPLCHQLTSKDEEELASLLRSHGVEVEQKRRDLIYNPSTGRGLELDIYIPSHKLAIEYNGLYWHSEEGIRDEDIFSNVIEPQEYHLLKTVLCEEKGIQLIHIFEDDWRERKDRCVNLILSRLDLLEREPIGARQTEVKEVSSEEARSFYSKYHIQGMGYGECFGLYHKGILVSAISVMRAPSNTIDAGSHILNRYASKDSLFVIGGIEKLLKYAEETLDIARWVSYADRTISNGALYERLGWEKEGVSKPDYKYIVNKTRHHKFNYRVKRFREDPELIYKEGMSESQLARLNKIPRIWDCGKIKYSKEIG